MHEVLLEEKHRDNYAIKGKTSIEANSYIKAKILRLQYLILQMYN